MNNNKQKEGIDEFVERYGDWSAAFGKMKDELGKLTKERRLEKEKG
jgi:hypothetical protein